MSVGQGGSPTGTVGPGWGDGAPGGTGQPAPTENESAGSSGGGGGATTVKLNGQTLLVAAGGGAGGSAGGPDPRGGAGGSGGSSPGNGAGTHCSVDGGSGDSAGGRGGGATDAPGIDGFTGDRYSPAGGGGGGGLNGGVGGGARVGSCATGGGGGAGSSFILDSAILPTIGTAIQYGNGLVTVEWLTAPLTLAITGLSPTVPAGATVQLAVDLVSSDTVISDVTQQVSWSLSDSSDVLTPDARLTVRAAGSHTVTASLGAYSGNVTFTVEPGLATGPVTLSAPQGAQIGQTSTFVLASYDQYGNIVQNLTDQAVLSTDNTSDASPGTASPSRPHPARARSPRRPTRTNTTRRSWCLPTARQLVSSSRSRCRTAPAASS